MTFIGRETQPPVNQSQTGSYNVGHASPLQPLELSSVGRRMSLNIRKLSTKAFSHFLILIFIIPPYSQNPISLL